MFHQVQEKFWHQMDKIQAMVLEHPRWSNFNDNSSKNIYCLSSLLINSNMYKYICLLPIKMLQHLNKYQWEKMEKGCDPTFIKHKTFRYRIPLTAILVWSG